MKKIKITTEGYKKLKQELEYLKTVKRPQVIERIAAARELGDLSENSDYDDAREQQSFIEGKILELENKLKTCQIMKKASSNGKVEMGSSVTVKSRMGEAVYKIVGENEADPLNNKISIESPIGSVLFGAKQGDVVKVRTPSGNVIYKVLKIE
jgi:transcription elongation factor GreA